MLPCVCKNWHCARVTRPQPARYRATRGPSIASPPLFPKNTTHRIPLPLSLSLSLSSFAITRHPCSRPLPCSATFVALRSPCHPLPDNVLRSPFPFFGFSFFFFFWFFALELFLEGNGRRPDRLGSSILGCADRAFLNYARFMRGAREPSLWDQWNGETVTKGRLRL